MAVTLESALFMCKNFQNNQNSSVNTADLTLQQMFHKTTKLVVRFGNDWLGKTFMETSVIDW